MNKTYIGGLGTGALRIDDDGRTALCGAVKTNDIKKNSVDTQTPLSFAIFADNGLCRLLVREENDPDAVPPEAFLKTDEGNTCRIRCDLGTLTLQAEYVSPYILGNAVDSGIPAVFVTFRVRNNTRQGIDFSIIGRVKSFFGRAQARISYFKNEQAVFAGLSTAAAEDEYAKTNGIGLACDASDFTYAALPRLNDSSFLRTVRSGSGYLTNTGRDSDNILLAAHEHVEGNEERSVRFLLSWHCPSRPDGEKSYYAHCFNDEESCAAYCFAGQDRLLDGTEMTKRLLYADAADKLLGHACGKTSAKTGAPFLFRRYDGIIEDADRFCGTEDILFPNEFRASVAVYLEQLTNAMPHAPADFDALLRELRFVSRYLGFLRQTDETTANVVDPDRLTALCDICLSAAEKAECGIRDGIRLLGTRIRVCTLLQTVLPELPKKKKNEYAELSRQYKDQLSAICGEKGGKLSSLILSEAGKTRCSCGETPFSDTLIYSAAEDCRPDKDSADYFMAAELIRLGYYEKAAACAAHLRPMAKADGLFAAVMAVGGFDYDAKREMLAMQPADCFCDDDGLTSSIFSTPDAYGIIEQGEDYIEVRVLSGRLKVRTVNVSHKPYKVLYRGRLMPCEIERNTVTMESALIIDEERKLTVLVDTAK